MLCTRCGSTEDKVIDTRVVDNGKSIRRRRECLECGNRFTTVERIEGLQMRVVKKDGTHQDFSREKLMNGLLSACSKRPVSNETLEQIANDVESAIQAKRNLELTTDEIGEMVMERLRETDKVAYVRFASVYRDFTDVTLFTKEVEKINSDEE
ncbi:MAG: transcriptional regulator NrdR [Clostridia bacterium]|nr:transcriptional regulator NrdR [Clostridia bacterium]